jgi:hypothetical protein
MSQFDKKGDGKKSLQRNDDRWAPLPDNSWRERRRPGLVLFHYERALIAPIPIALGQSLTGFRGCSQPSL